MKIKDIMHIIEKFAPLDLQAEYDNSGLIIGNPENNFSGAVITLDTTLDTVKEAIDNKANLIIEHHPTIFSCINEIDLNNPQGKILEICIKNDITIYAAHTNIDFAENGLNARYLKLLGANFLAFNQGVMIGSLSEKTSLINYVENLEQKFGEKLLFSGSKSKKIEKIACVNGSGGNVDNVILAFNEADVFISSEFKHSALMLAKNLNYAIIQISHFASEISFLDLIYELLAKNNKIENIEKSVKCNNPWGEV